MKYFKEVNSIPGFQFHIGDKFITELGVKYKIKGFVKNKSTKQYAVQYKNLKTKEMKIMSKGDFENSLINDRFRYITKEDE